MSTIEFNNNIYASISGARRLTDALLIEEKLTKIETEWSAGTNTDFSINTGKVTNLNTAMVVNNIIGTPGKTTLYGISELTNTGSVTDDKGIKSAQALSIHSGGGADVPASATVFLSTQRVPNDDTIPQNTEMRDWNGVDNFSYTPNRIGNKLIISISGVSRFIYMAGAGSSPWGYFLVGLSVNDNESVSALTIVPTAPVPYNAVRVRGEFLLRYVYTVTSLEETNFTLHVGIINATAEQVGLDLSFLNGLYYWKEFGAISIEEFTQ